MASSSQPAAAAANDAAQDHRTRLSLSLLDAAEVIADGARPLSERLARVTAVRFVALICE